MRHVIHVLMLHGANLVDGNGQIDFAGLLKLQRQRKGLPFFKRLFKPNDHHVQLLRVIAAA